MKPADQALEIPALPELDGQIYVRVMTAGERQLYAETAIKASQSGVFVSDFEIVAVNDLAAPEILARVEEFFEARLHGEMAKTS